MYNWSGNLHTPTIFEAMLSISKPSPTILFILLFAGFSHLVAAQEPVPEFKDQVVVVQFESGTIIGKTTAKQTCLALIVQQRGMMYTR